MKKVILLYSIFLFILIMFFASVGSGQSGNEKTIYDSNTGDSTTWSYPLGELSSEGKFIIDIKTNSEFPWKLLIYRNNGTEPWMSFLARNQLSPDQGVITGSGYYTIKLMPSSCDISVGVNIGASIGLQPGALCTPINWRVSVKKYSSMQNEPPITNQLHNDTYQEGNPNVQAQEKPVNPVGNPIQITDVSWNSDLRVIEITLNEWPQKWNNWKMYLNGNEMPMEGGKGNAIVRPNAPLDQNPTGLFIGTAPWLSSLDQVDFPCCGKIKFYIPGKGYTNEFYFNVGNLCKTASNMNCKSTPTLSTSILPRHAPL